jgi:hypothetical protein
MKYGMEKGPRRHATAPTQPPMPRSLMNILPTVEPPFYGQPESKRGGAGTYRQVSPDPRKTHQPQPKARGVC